MTQQIEKCAEALLKNNFDVAVVGSKEEAFDRIKSEIEDFMPKIVGMGGSMTMRDCGIIEWIKDDKRFKLLDSSDHSMSATEKMEIRRQTLLSDLFITGVNAMTTIGTLHWLDMIGNRIAPIAYGPHKVILVVGRNKIVDSREQADDRIRTIAAPQNIGRLAFKTPCAITGVCSDCSSPQRICNTHMRVEKCFPPKRILVVIIDEDLGL